MNIEFIFKKFIMSYGIKKFNTKIKLDLIVSILACIMLTSCAAKPLPDDWQSGKTEWEKGSPRQAIVRNEHQSNTVRQETRNNEASQNDENDWGVVQNKSLASTTPKQASVKDANVPSDVDVNIPNLRKENKDAIAVVIGNTNYQKTKKVDYSVNDAQSVRKYLINVFGYREDNIFFIQDASKTDFELHFGNEKNHKGKLFNAVKEGKSDVFVYYSGHGAPGLKDRKGYFVPVEADPHYIELSGYPADVFYQNLSKIPACSVTVVLDACFSGATIFDSISPMVLVIDNPVIKLQKGVVLSSSSNSQVSAWYNEKKHGMFTYFFLKAIKEKITAPGKDKSITFEEVYEYVADKTEGVPYYSRRFHGVEQNPTMEGNYQGKILLTY